MSGGYAICGHKTNLWTQKSSAQNKSVDTKRNCGHKSELAVLRGLETELWTQNENVDTKVSCAGVICGHKTELWTQKTLENGSNWLFLG